jgi:hypothetical protein
VITPLIFVSVGLTSRLFPADTAYFPALRKVKPTTPKAIAPGGHNIAEVKANSRQVPEPRFAAPPAMNRGFAIGLTQKGIREQLPSVKAK